MNPTVESIQSATTTTGTLTITKPTSTAIGDLLIATIGSKAALTSTPSGWTLLSTVNNTFTYTSVYWVIATSTQTAASNFSWTISGAGEIAGGISRITGDFYTTSSPVAVFASGTFTLSASPVFTITVTPNNLSSLLLFCVTASQNGTGSSSISGYSVATSNPTWTEKYDLTITNTGIVTHSMASATRTQKTATGDASATLARSDYSSAIMIVVRPKVLFSFSETITIVETRMKTINKIFSEAISLTETFAKKLGRLWTTVTKPVTTWINKIKP